MQFIGVCDFFPIKENIKENFENLLTAILNRYFDLLNAIFMQASIFLQANHTLLIIKEQATFDQIISICR